MPINKSLSNILYHITQWGMAIIFLIAGYFIIMALLALAGNWIVSQEIS